MTLPARSTALVALLCSLALPAWGQHYYLYEPKPAAPDAKEQAKDGVLVKEVPVRQGDTLYGISRKFSGHGVYYPQILLFNDIKDPNLIYTGDTLRIPLPHGDVPDALAPVVQPRTKAHKTGKTKKQSSGSQSRSSQKEPAAAEKKTVENTVELPLTEPKKADQAVSPSAAATGGQQIFEKAVKAYRQDDCRTALELFDRYLTDYAASPMAADASLYKAECYLKLSAQ